MTSTTTATIPDRLQRRTRENQEPQPTDIDERLTALRRRTAAASRTRERQLLQQQSAERSTTPPSSPAQRSPRPAPATRRIKLAHEADHDDFSRRLKISSPEPISKIYNPQRAFSHSQGDFRCITVEPEALSDANGSSHLLRPPANSSPSDHGRDTQPRQLFDYRKDDPMRFNVLPRPSRPVPTTKSSGDYVSASSTSSYSSTFTLSSATDASSSSSAFFDRPGAGRGEDSTSNALALQLKKLYRDITSLEAKVKLEESEERGGNNASSSCSLRREAKVTLKGKQPENEVMTDGDLERDKWKGQMVNHKLLADNIHSLLRISLNPTVPVSLRNIPTKYNIIVRLWTFAFHKLLESLRRASFSSRIAFEHLQDFIFYSYGFYTSLLEEPPLSGFKSGWLEALGDLARYRMAVSAMFNAGTNAIGSSGRKLTVEDVNEVVVDEKANKPKVVETGSISDKSALIERSPPPSVGVAAARSLEVESEPELWRRIAKEWYGSGLAEQPGTGKLHHHLGLLVREVEGEELRGIYHFAKSMTALHPFSTSRESVLPMWSTVAQTRRLQSDNGSVRDLFILLHGMLFTHVQLDDFLPTLARFIERLDLEDLEEREWLMMAIVNLASIFEYGKSGSVIGRLSGREAVTATTVMITKTSSEVDERMDVDEPGKINFPVKIEQPSLPPTESEGISIFTPELASTPDHPQTFKYAIQLTFSMLSYVLKHPIRRAKSALGTAALNPYLIVLLTFLATALRNQRARNALERNVPWDNLVSFFAKIPRGVMTRQGLLALPGKEPALTPAAPVRWTMLTSGCAPPLPEDWSMRGMEWVGRNLFERGYWKNGEERRPEIELLEERDAHKDVADGYIEDDDDEHSAFGTGTTASKAGILSREASVMKKRWVRIIRSAVGIASAIDGFSWVEGTREWKVDGSLANKVKRWREEDRAEREIFERRRVGTRWGDDPMDVDEEDPNDSLSGEEDDDVNDTEEVKALKARRRYLQALLKTPEQSSTIISSPRRCAKPVKQSKCRSSLPIVPGYTVLVLDTNILLSSLSDISSLIESLRWTVIVPLPVIMELEGLSVNSSLELADTAQNAMEYVSSHIRTHTLSLKVQTSRGNYLNSLGIRTEQIDFSTTDGNWERNMDDLILKAAIWQEEHWIDRSAMLKSRVVCSGSDTSFAVKVVLLSLDRNLRLKARSRHLPAASEKDLASVLASAS